MNPLPLPGLEPRPLSSYLAAIGLFRVVADQADPAVRASWSARGFQLHTHLDQRELRQFLSESYQPSPLVAPWNGKDQGGFLPGASTRATALVAWIEDTSTERLATYRDAIAATRAVVEQPRWQDAFGQTKSNKLEGTQKAAFIRALRNTLPDDALAFIDSAVALSTDRAGWPPIFGTGGNIGHFDVVINYVEHLQRILEPRRGDDPSTWLNETLYGLPAPGVKSTPSQFDYAGVGGANLGRVGAGAKRVNPWTYLLTVEGALTFAATATRRMGSQRTQTSAPFTVSASHAGYASASTTESAKGEMWMPTWTSPWGWLELESLLGEGRATWSSRPVTTGVDLLRAIQTLGVDRGVDGFERYIFLDRNGRDPVTIPVSSFRVPRDPSQMVRLTAALDTWIRRLNQGGDDRTPAAIRTARNLVNRSLFELAERPDAVRLRSLLLAVARAERAVFRSSQYRASTGIGPVPALSQAWVDNLATPELEFHIARVLANGHDPWERSTASGIPPRSLREFLRPVEVNRYGRLAGFSSRPPRVAGTGSRPVIDLLADAAVERAHTAPEIPEREGAPFRGVRPQFAVWPAKGSGSDPRAPRRVVEALATGALDENRLGEWLEVLLLTDPIGLTSCDLEIDQPYESPSAPLWRVLSPWFAQRTMTGRRTQASGDDGDDRSSWRLVPVVRPSWPARLRYGSRSDVEGLVREAHSAYAAAGLRPGFDPSVLGRDLARTVAADRASANRVLAALLVPTRIADLARVAENHLRIDQGANI